MPGSDCTIRVRLQPRASRDEVVGWREGVLVLRLTAPPVEGAANEACRRFVARLLGVPPRDVELVAGHKSRDKRFQVSGLTEADAKDKIDAGLRDGNQE